MTEQGVPEIDVTELKRRLDAAQPLVLLDVREPFEKDIADLPEVGQHRIPMIELGRRVDELDPGAPTVVYCRTGSRSEMATRYLASRGFGSVYNLAGGVMAWRDEIDPSLQEY